MNASVETPKRSLLVALHELIMFTPGCCVQTKPGRLPLTPRDYLAKFPALYCGGWCKRHAITAREIFHRGVRVFCITSMQRSCARLRESANISCSHALRRGQDG